VKGVGGYGRYDDDPGHVGCPRAQSDMTPCIARDGRLALDGSECVGCGAAPGRLLSELAAAAGVDVDRSGSAAVQADRLRGSVRDLTEPLAQQR
jgi:hypothetical protein